MHPVPVSSFGPRAPYSVLPAATATCGPAAERPASAAVSFLLLVLWRTLVTGLGIAIAAVVGIAALAFVAICQDHATQTHAS